MYACIAIIQLKRIQYVYCNSLEYDIKKNILEGTSQPYLEERGKVRVTRFARHLVHGQRDVKSEARLRNKRAVGLLLYLLSFGFVRV